MIAMSAIRRLQQSVDIKSEEHSKSLIVVRRRAFRWLPVLYTSDLVHGSWWFVLGSALTTAIAAVIFSNVYDPSVLHGTEKSILSERYYLASWGLLIFSGAAYTVGSVIFVRAVSLPRRPPLIPCLYHVGTDELLASWLFFIATLPAVPYCALFLTQSNAYLYWCMLAAGLAAVLACGIFVYVCYPSTTRRTYILRLAIMLGGDRPWMHVHIGEDWLVATWLVYFSCLVATVAFLGYTLYEMLYDHCVGPCAFLHISSTVDCFLFLVGSAYFVAGSYAYAEELTISDSESGTAQPAGLSGSDLLSTTRPA